MNISDDRFMVTATRDLDLAVVLDAGKSQVIVVPSLADFWVKTGLVASHSPLIVLKIVSHRPLGQVNHGIGGVLPRIVLHHDSKPFVDPNEGVGIATVLDESNKDAGATNQRGKKRHQFRTGDVAGLRDAEIPGNSVWTEDVSWGGVDRAVLVLRTCFAHGGWFLNPSPFDRR